MGSGMQYAGRRKKHAKATTPAHRFPRTAHQPEASHAHP
ncbi:hypothetical protein Dcar01_02181 [Deinococcus carri]|uniref:Uncharacterized protein n=1 Tax=Deinococcus carri TaxID=1211323 RepID=A0ABP9W8I4_9DEIO